MTRSADRARRWSRTTVGFAADLVLYTGIGLVLWLVVPALLLGWQPIMITSGSMSPAIEPGDVILIQQGIPPEGEWFVPGTILTFEDRRQIGDGPLETRLVTHRVNNIDGDGNYVTRGDANATVDSRPVTSERVVGAGRLLLPWIGLPVQWARQGQVVELAIFLLFLIGVLLASRLEDEEELARLERIERNEARRRSRASGLEPLTIGARDAQLPRRRSGPLRPPRRLQPPLDDQHIVVRRRRQDHLPPLGAIVLVLAMATGAVIPAAHAAFSDASANTGNTFATAPTPAEPPSMVLPPFIDGNGDELDVIDDSGTNPGQTETFTYDFVFDQDLVLDGIVSARLLALRDAPGNSPATISVTIRADGNPIAAGSIDFRGNGWQMLEFDLDDLGPIDATFPANTPFEVEIELRRAGIDVGSGQSEILLPLAD